jgi:uncharacterized membrane protein
MSSSAGPVSASTLPRRSATAVVPGDEVEETPKERTDRQLLELLNELRVALPGAQFLFAFLLAVPFAARFDDVSHGLQLVFYVCLLSTLAATILLMAPAVYHRIRWQQGNKTDVIRIAHRMFLAGMAALAVAMTTAVWFVSAFLFGTVESLVAATLSVVLLGLTWFALPLRNRSHVVDAE